MMERIKGLIDAPFTPFYENGEVNLESDGGSLGQGFAMLSIVVAVALVLQIYFLRPKTDNMVD